MNRFLWIVVSVIALAFPGKANSQIYEWVGTGGDTDWTNLNNWLDTVTLTNPASLAALHASQRIQIGTNTGGLFTSNGIPTFPVGQTAAPGALWIGGAESATLTQAGGSITAALQVGAFGNAFPGRFLMNGGSFLTPGVAIVGNQSVAGHELTIGNATMQVNGAMQVSNASNASSTINVNSGGILTVVGNFLAGNGVDVSATVIVNGGTINTGNQFNVGNTGSSTGTVTLNTGANLNVQNNFRLGWMTTVANGAVLNIHGGQLTTLANNTDISMAVPSGSSATSTMTGGGMKSNRNINVANGDSSEVWFNMSGGLSEAVQDFRAGVGPGSTANFDIENGQIKARDILFGVGQNALVDLIFSGGEMLATRDVRFGGPGSDDGTTVRARSNVTMLDGSIVADANVDFTRTNFTFAGGTIDAAGGSVLGPVSVDFTGGILSYTGDRLEDVAGWVDMGRFVTSLPGHVVGAVLDDGRTYVQAVPGGTLLGDFNLDGKVDAADYVIWRKNGDPPAKYDEWRSNFGASQGAGAGNGVNTAAVPEPSSAVIMLSLVLLLAIRPGRNTFAL